MNIGEMQRKLSVWAERDKERKFYGLFDLVCQEDWLRLAHDYVAQNAGCKTGGCDGVNMKEFDEDLEGNLNRLRETLQSDKFVACPVRRVYIPKTNGKVRPLGIPTIRDRIVQEAVRMALEPIFEADFSQRSFGFRPNRCTMDAIRHLMDHLQEGKNYFWIIEGDISAYFDTINHRKLMKLLGRRIEDEKLLSLIWKFLRAGVMERKLFKDTKLGTPQGGIVSPLLANVYLHELDKFMEKLVAIPRWTKEDRRKRGLGNYAYSRYADDFVILCNGTREQTMAVRDEVRDFLRDNLKLTLSTEKTKVTHINDGFDFLGFHLQRALGGKGLVTKITIPQKAMERHRNIIRRATAPNTHEDSFATKILSLNRIIGGWCRYYQYTSKAYAQFTKQWQMTFWAVAHWIGRKHRINMPEILTRFRAKKDGFVTLGEGKFRLLRHQSFRTLRYKVSPFKPNPYTTQEIIRREELLNDNPWLGTEDRPGAMDLRLLALERDDYHCRLCKKPVTGDSAQVDHFRPVRFFKRPVDANRLENLWTLCIPCHQWKTEYDRRTESRMQ
jgi:RNA-directed DNA polymerase